MNIRKNDGITLGTLAIMIVILLIISSITISGELMDFGKTKDAVKLSELNMIQHAILERYTKSQFTKNDLPGTSITKSDVQLIINEINTQTGCDIELKGNENDYKILQNQDLKNLGIKASDSYIVNYYTGEVINRSIKVTETGKALYIDNN